MVARTRLIPAASVLLLVQSSMIAQTVTNVRAQQLADKSVEITYDLSGAPSQGATVRLALSSSGGAAYGFYLLGASPSGAVGPGVTNGTSKRIIWDVSRAGQGYYQPNFKAMILASAIPQEVSLTLPGGAALAMVRIPGGLFHRGSWSGERGRSTNEDLGGDVLLTSDYFLAKNEITQRQWYSIMGSRPSYFSNCGDECPVESVTWNEVAGPDGFIARLNSHLTATGQVGSGKLRLPTEAEWERAARADTITRFSFGDALDCDDACVMCSVADRNLWWCGNSTSRPHTVKSREPNAFGLYDMHGNVAEWCQDWHTNYMNYYQPIDPTGPQDGDNGIKVVRGGAWGWKFAEARSAARPSGFGSSNRYYSVGFRPAMSLDPSSQQAAGYSNVFTIDLRTDPATCASFSISPSSLNATPGSGSGQVTLTGSPSGCTGGSWNANTLTPWLDVNPKSGTGPGSVTITWQANYGTQQRSGTVAVAGKTVTVTQDASAVSLAISNVRARHLASGNVEILYNLSGAPSSGVPIRLLYSLDGGTTFPGRAAAAASGAVGDHVSNGNDLVLEPA